MTVFSSYIRGTLDQGCGYGYQFAGLNRRFPSRLHKRVIPLMAYARRLVGSNSELFGMNTSSHNQVRTALVVAFCGFALLGCSKKIEEKTEAPKSQVVARIGDEVVTTQELDNEFRLANIPTEKRKDAAAVRQILGELVTRKYMVRKALDAKLDREPTVLLDMLRARELVLANAVGSREVAEKSSAITKSDIDSYIANNPLKFANRQIVSVEEIVFPANATSQALVDATKEMKTLDEVDQKLAAMGIAHARSMGTINSADVSSDFFNLMQAKQADDIFFIRSGANGVFFKVKGIESHALEGEGAVNVARQLLRVDLMKSEASMMAVAANLEAKYEGDYANIMKQEPSQQK
jgi:EpsD family peptidyl-prolyl cis-trans isomerase